MERVVVNFSSEGSDSGGIGGYGSGVVANGGGGSKDGGSVGVNLIGETLGNLHGSVVDNSIESDNLVVDALCEGSGVGLLFGSKSVDGVLSMSTAGVHAVGEGSTHAVEGVGQTDELRGTLCMESIGHAEHLLDRGKRIIATSVEIDFALDEILIVGPVNGREVGIDEIAGCSLTKDNGEKSVGIGCWVVEFGIDHNSIGRTFQDGDANIYLLVDCEAVVGMTHHGLIAYGLRGLGECRSSEQQCCKEEQKR